MRLVVRRIALSGWLLVAGSAAGRAQTITERGAMAYVLADLDQTVPR